MMDMTTTTQPRTPAGTSRGGQFAESPRSEGDITGLGANDGGDFLSVLDESPLAELSGGLWGVVDASVEGQPGRSPGTTRLVVHLGGRPCVKVRSLAAASIYAALEGGAEVGSSRIESLLDKPATLLFASRSGDVRALECRPSRGRDGTILLIEKGSQTKGWRMSSALGNLLDVAPGYGQQEALAATFRRRMAQFVPDVEEVSDADRMDYLPDGDDESTWDVENPAIQAAFMVTGPDLGNGPQPGCVFLATDIQRGSNPGERSIVNGYFWAPTDTGLYSEHGSMYVDDIARGGGRITGYEPGSLTSRQCWQELPEDRGEGYRRILGLSSIKEA